jgi:hypothetical protein
MIELMLTTYDNPYDPFLQFDDWYAYDTRAGYHTCGFLARVVFTSENLSDLDQSIAINEAIEEIVRENVLGIYRKISKET